MTGSSMSPLACSALVLILVLMTAPVTAQPLVWAHRGFRVHQESEVNREPPEPLVIADRDAGTLIIKSTNGVQVTRIADGALLHSIGVLQGFMSITGTSVTPDGARVVVRDSTGRMQLLDVRTRQRLGTGPQLVEPVSARSFVSTDGSSMLLCDAKVLRYLRLPSFESVWTREIITDHRSSALEISPDGRRGLSLVLETLEVFDLATGDTIWRRPLYPDLFGIRQASFADSGRLVVTYDGGRIGVWDASSGRLLRTITDRNRDPYTAMFARPHGRSVVTWLYSWSYGVPAVVDILDSSRIAVPLEAAADAGVYSIALTTDGKGIVAITDDGSIRVRSLGDSTFGPRVVLGHPIMAGRPAVSPDGATIATSRDGRLSFFDTDRGTPMGSTLIDGHHWLLAGFSPDGSRVALVGVVPGSISVFDTSARRIVFRDRESGASSAPVYSPDGRSIAFGSGNAVVIVDATTLEEKRRLTGHGRSVTTVRFTRDGARLLSGSDDGTVNDWDLPTGMIRSTIDFGSGVREFVLTRDETQAIALLADGTLSEQALDGSRVRVIGTVGPGHVHIDLTDGGHAIIVSGRTTRAIDRRTGAELYRFVDSLDFTSDVMYATVVPGTGRFAAGGHDGDVMMWQYAGVIQPTAVPTTDLESGIRIRLRDDVLDVAGPLPRGAVLRIVDVRGHSLLVSHGNDAGELRVSASSLTSGAYVVSVESGESILHSERITIAR